VAGLPKDNFMDKWSRFLQALPVAKPTVNPMKQIQNTDDN